MSKIDWNQLPEDFFVDNFPFTNRLLSMQLAGSIPIAVRSELVAMFPASFSVAHCALYDKCDPRFTELDNIFRSILIWANSVPWVASADEGTRARMLNELGFLSETEVPEIARSPSFYRMALNMRRYLLSEGQRQNYPALMPAFLTHVAHFLRESMDDATRKVLDSHSDPDGPCWARVSLMVVLAKRWHLPFGGLVFDAWSDSSLFDLSEDAIWTARALGGTYDRSTASNVKQEAQAMISIPPDEIATMWMKAVEQQVFLPTGTHSPEEMASWVVKVCEG